MRLLIALGEALPPQQGGGSQKAALEVAAGLTAAGDHVEIAGRLDVLTPYGIARALPAHLSRRFHFRDRSLGVPTYRYYREAEGFRALLRKARPQVVLLHSMSAMPIAHLTAEAGLPLVIYWHDVEFKKLRGSPEGLDARFVANSEFTKERVLRAFGRDCVVINPVFKKPGPHPVMQSVRSRVLFINPVADKGVGHALQIAARCRHIPFEFLESWALDRSSRRRLEDAIRALPNVTLTRRQTDMAPVYARSKLLIVPSRWEEAWGRVVTEAQTHGIPVLATRVGGLPEAVGDGGLLFDLESGPELWAGAVERLWSDRADYAALASKAVTRGMRINPEENLRRLREELERAAAG